MDLRVRCTILLIWNSFIINEEKDEESYQTSSFFDCVDMKETKNWIRLQAMFSKSLKGSVADTWKFYNVTMKLQKNLHGIGRRYRSKIKIVLLYRPQDAFSYRPVFRKVFVRCHLVGKLLNGTTPHEPW